MSTKLSYKEIAENVQFIFEQSISYDLTPLQSAGRTLVEMERISENSEIEDLMVLVQVYKHLVERSVSHEEIVELISEHITNGTLQRADLESNELLSIKNDLVQLKLAN